MMDKQSAVAAVSSPCTTALMAGRPLRGVKSWITRRMKMTTGRRAFKRLVLYFRKLRNVAVLKNIAVMDGNGTRAAIQCCRLMPRWDKSILIFVAG